MPAKSKAQQRLMGMVYADKKGELKNPPKIVKDVAQSISKKDAKDFAETKASKLPDHVKEEDAEAKPSFLAFLEDYADIVERFENGDLQLDEAKKTTKLSKSIVRKVYHRDYLKTKNKPYRKYDKKKRGGSAESGSE